MIKRPAASSLARAKVSKSAKVPVALDGAAFHVDGSDDVATNVAIHASGIDRLVMGALVDVNNSATLAIPEIAADAAEVNSAVISSAHQPRRLLHADMIGPNVSNGNVGSSACNLSSLTIAPPGKNRRDIGTVADLHDGAALSVPDVVVDAADVDTAVISPAHLPRGLSHTHDRMTISDRNVSVGNGGSSACEPSSLVIASPGKNRERFMDNCQPQRVCCNLNAAGLSSAGTRFSFQAVVFVVYPASDKPERRHVLLIDSTGCTGLTVWNAHVPLFNCASVGSVVKFTKLGMIHHNGKKALSMSRDTTVVFVSSTIVTEEAKWWNSLVSQRVKRIIDIHDCEDDCVVNVAGIVGMLSSETKRVRSDNKDLMNMRLTDRTGWVDVRSWNHSESEFCAFLEKPLLLVRVRVTSFAGLKICELIDGNGTVVNPTFDGQEDLQDYWLE